MKPSDEDRLYRAELQKILIQHGFRAAAYSLCERGEQRINFHHVITSWETYPACMDQYPTHRQKR
jgi:hypothetical protein